jgi:hypothetical protein
MMRQLVGAAVEFLVRQALVADNNRHGPGAPRHLLSKKLMNTTVFGKIGCRVVPLDEKLAALLFIEFRWELLIPICNSLSRYFLRPCSQAIDRSCTHKCTLSLQRSA